MAVDLREVISQFFLIDVPSDVLIDIRSIVNECASIISICKLTSFGGKEDVTSSIASCERQMMNFRRVRQSGLRLCAMLQEQKRAYVHDVLAVTQAHLDAHLRRCRDESLRLCRLAQVQWRFQKRSEQIDAWLARVDGLVLPGYDLPSLLHSRCQILGLVSELDNSILYLYQKLKEDEAAAELLGSSHSNSYESHISSARCHLQSLLSCVDSAIAAASDISPPVHTFVPEDSPPVAALKHDTLPVAMKSDFAKLKLMSVQEVVATDQPVARDVRTAGRALEASGAFIQRYQMVPGGDISVEEECAAALMIEQTRFHHGYLHKQIELTAEVLEDAVARTHQSGLVEFVEAFVQFDEDHDGCLSRDQVECLLVSLDSQIPITTLDELYSDETLVPLSRLCKWYMSCNKLNESTRVLRESLLSLSGGGATISSSILRTSLEKSVADALELALPRVGNQYKIDAESVAQALKKLESL